MITAHTRPAAAVEEMEDLDQVVSWARNLTTNEEDYIILGDFNASCTYATDAQVNALSFHGAGYQWIVPNEAYTNQSNNTECAYDRIVITEETSDNYSGDWGIVNITNLSVSDHHAVWPEFLTQ